MQLVPVGPYDGVTVFGGGFGPPERSVYEIGRAIQLVAIWPRVCDIRGGGGAFGGAGGDAMGCVPVKQSSRTRIFENDELNSTQCIFLQYFTGVFNRIPVQKTQFEDFGSCRIPPCKNSQIASNTRFCIDIIKSIVLQNSCKNNFNPA